MTNNADLFDRPQTIYTVSRLNREARFVLNELFGTLWIEGEISNLSAPSSGHLYFTLKDADAQVRCAMFRPQARLTPFKPKNGDHILAKAQVGLYEPRGDFQLVVESLEEAGDGALVLALEALKQRLSAEGLFDAAHKKPIPSLPGCVGVMTSPTGAAVHDVLTVLRRRFPALPVIVFPVKVQGSEAKGDIVRALERADRLGLCDVLILTRGGGALEDLSAFNEEAVARAIHACRIPVVSAVGHEIDFTIADFVADLRAPTPSAAAAAVSPDGAAWLAQFERLESRLEQAARNRLRQASERLGFLDKRLQQRHPAKRLNTQAQRLDELESRLRRAIGQRLHLSENRLHTQTARLLGHRPDWWLMRLAEKREQLAHRLRTAMRHQLEAKRGELAGAGQKLQAISPLATLARGYAIARHAESGRIVRSCREVQAGERLAIRLSDGAVESVVEAVREEKIT